MIWKASPVSTNRPSALPYSRGTLPRLNSASAEQCSSNCGAIRTRAVVPRTLPARGDLARWLVHAAEAKIPLQGAADHLVSEALYLADPEGNGIEIYIDRPREAWKRTGDLIAMSSDPLDIEGLMASTEGRHWRGFPEGSVIGHVHLQVGSIPPAEEFYTRLGFDITCHYPGATFYGSGGYHHHLATNIWNSRNAPVRSGPSTGLADVEIVFDAARLRLDDAGNLRSHALRVLDPWGTELRILPPAI
jgi:catechol 2,3-dioxygenase